MNDTISRREAVDALFDWEMTYDWDEHCREEDPKPAYIVSPSDVIEQLPSAQTERKKGRWLTSDDMYETGICSVCGHDSQEPVSYTITMYKYCPNCGADMRGEENGCNTGI